MQLENVEFNQLIGAAGVILVMIGAYNAIMTAVKNYLDHKQRKDAPVDAMAAKLEAHDKMLANDKERLDSMDKRVNSLATQNTIMLRGVRALLSHEINGNSIDKLQNSMSEIDDYLIKRD